MTVTIPPFVAGLVVGIVFTIAAVIAIALIFFNSKGTT